MIPPEAIKTLTEDGKTYAKALDMVRSFHVVDEDTHAKASALVKSAKVALTGLEEKRTSITQPLLQAKRAADDLFRAPTEALKQIEKHLKGEIGAFVLRQQEARARVMVESAALAEQGTVPTEIVPVVPETKGQTVRMVWEFRVTDPNLVPREYLKPDLDLIGARSRDRGQYDPPPALPGIEYYLKPSVIVR